MSGFGEMLVCAIRRAGRPMHAAEAVEVAIGLAQDHWPKASWVRQNPHTASKLLNDQKKKGNVVQKGTVKDKSTGHNPRVLWEPTQSYDARAPVPEWSGEDDEKTPHKLAGRTQMQVFAFINCTEDMLDVFARQRREQEELMAKQHDELKKAFADIKRELALYGFKEEEL